jgi:voltage-gated potassium channel
MAGVSAASDQQRWRTLRELELWLRRPMMVLSLIWLFWVLAEFIWFPGGLVPAIGVAIWVIFIAEFALRFALAPSKSRFVTSNWLTAVALAVPAIRIFAAFRFLRFARLARGLNLVRIVGTANRGMNALRRSMRRRGFGFVLATTTVVWLLGAAGMLAFEPASEVAGGMRGYADALWWTGMLLTTIGSAFWPETAEGRLLCFLLALYSLGVLGYITASLASFFVGEDAQRSGTGVIGSGEFERLRQEIALLREEVVVQRHMRT